MISLYERRRQRLLSRRAFAKRLLNHGIWALLLAVGSLALGTLGFHFISRQPWIDAFLNASMLLGGMGPVGDLGPSAGKLFASIYALYAGLVFLVVAGILFAPVFHRVLHHFHLEGRDDEASR
ncbi:MAG TPA: hypothetical protein VFG76_11185 [Candidatus Polarisedimenticolia bacterium]|nr:hypothetical protein [Candidatus Polarisedimenticolia bacterium]